MQTELLLDNLGLIDDLHLGQPRMIGTYVLLGDEPALVDPGPASTLANLEAGLTVQGLTFDDVQALLLTHIHLDHAGATGTLVARHPHLRVYVHQVGAPHVVAPERLIRSATRLYGDEMERLWGEVHPVPKDNVIPLSGGETIRLGEHTLHAHDTPGHASHHITYFDEVNGAAFVGDVTGVRLPDVPHVRPATPPPDIDLETWQNSLDTLRAANPDLLLLTHFGPVDEPAEHIEEFRTRLLRWAETVRQGLASGEDELAQIARLQALAEAELGPAVMASVRQSYQQVSPIDQNWQGLARYWRKTRIDKTPNS